MTSQNSNAIAIGYQAGSNIQGTYSIAIGQNAGYTTQGCNSIALGYTAGYTGQGIYTTAVGYGAGSNNQGSYSVALGYAAGVNSQNASSIIINASGTTLDATVSGFFVKPVRFLQYYNTATPSNAGNVISYNSNTSEVFYSDYLIISSVYTQFGVFSNGSYLASDSNVKQDIIPADLQICYDNLKELPLRRFTYIPSYASAKIDQTQLGFVAQEVYPMFPKSIYSTFDESISTNIMNLNFDQIFMSHYGATQLLISTVEQQQSTFQSLQLQTQEQESTIQSYNAQILTLFSSYETLVSRFSSFIS